MSQILDCGHSYTIEGPNGRVYRGNRVHLKPICYDGSTYQGRTTAKEDKQPKRDSFQDLKPKVKTVFFQMDTADVMARASHPPSHSSLQWHYSPRSPSHSPPSAFPARKSLVDPSSEESTPKSRERHKSGHPSSNPKILTRDLHWNFQHYYKKPHPWNHTKRRDQPKLKPGRLSAQCVEPFVHPN